MKYLSCFFFLKKWRQQDISSFQHYELRHSMLSSSVMIIDAKATAIHFALPYCITTSIFCTICDMCELKKLNSRKSKFLQKYFSFTTFFACLIAFEGTSKDVYLLCEYSNIKGNMLSLE